MRVEREKPCIKIWPFPHAPKEYRDLSTHEYSERWVSFVPNELMDGESGHESIPPSWLDNEVSDLGISEEHEVLGGRVFIHASPE